VLDAATQQFLDTAAEAGLHPDTLMFQAHASYPQAFYDAPRVDDGVVTREDLTLPTGSTGAIHIRIVRPTSAETPLPAVLYFPGGGWRVRDRTLHDRLVRRLAAHAGVVLIFVEHTSAIGAREPLRETDAYAALTYVVRNAEWLEVDGRRLAVAGDGLGGTMASTVALMSQAQRGPLLACQLLFYPIVSRNEATDSFRQYAEGPGMTAAAVRVALDEQRGDATAFDAVGLPLDATTDDLEGLAPALIITAENDVARDGAEAYARKLLGAGVDVVATRYLGTIHDFVVLRGLADTPPANAAIEQASRALRRALEKD
jgi:acetyl esterase